MTAPRACGRIATLTLNPTIDTALEAEAMVHTDKIRTAGERLDPGGGGINVARVLVRFGAPVAAIFMAGGSTGRLLDRLLQREGVERICVPIAGETRVSVTVYERSTGHEYRLVPEGPVLSEPEWQECLRQIGETECDWFVASGSLPGGVPHDFYARVAEILRDRATRFVVDAPAGQLAPALAGGGLFLVKPSRDELEQLSGAALTEIESVVEAARRIVSDGSAQNVAVSLGGDGAVLVDGSGAFVMPAALVAARSAVGAGDSFLAAMTYAFASGADRSTALRLGVAAGAAATLSPGTDLCHPWDVTRLAAELGRAAMA
ncbi:MAG TPA: 1-phosphofructokinase family hexose kinase [Sphingomicrobium sp.]|jgi:6-phosphofructokinase 2|nr:1-phosphofructokinase family hexose kinase [Sphingomicrobium sp.]